MAHYTNIDIASLPQNLLAHYYRALFKVSAQNQDMPEIESSNRACLIDISPKYKTNQTLVIRNPGKATTHEIHFYYVAAPHDGDWKYINSVLLPRLFKQHHCYGLFSQSGHTDIDFAFVRTAFEESRKKCSWAYNFFDSSKNLTPPIMPPCSFINDLEVMLACALCLDLNEPYSFGSISQAQVGQGQYWYMGLEFDTSQHYDTPTFSMSSPEADEYVSLRTEFITNLTGKTVDHLVRESDCYKPEE